MTNLEALKSIVGVNYPMDPNLFLKAMIDQEVSETGEYTKDNERSIDICSIQGLVTLITAPDIKEGGYSISIPQRDNIFKLISSLCDKWDLPDPFAFKGKIQDASQLW